jgi:hypothetical protein
MKTPLALAVLTAATLAARASTIDFTPRTADTVDDGIPMRRMYFADGARRIYYRPPPTWQWSGDERAIVFTPRDSERAIVKIQNGSPEFARLPLNQDGLDALRASAARLMPPDAVEVVETWETVNPVVLQGWTSVEFGFNYLQSGKLFCRSVLFINLDANRQVHFIVDALPGEFLPLYKTAYRTLATWWQQ